MQEIIDYLSSQEYLDLATSDRHGHPWAATLAYVSKGMDIYVITALDSRKVQNIKSNPDVAFTVKGDTSDWKNLQAMQAEGIAEIMPGDTHEEIGEMFRQKYKQFDNMPAANGMVVIGIKVTKGYFIDSSKGIGHRDEF